MNCQEAQSLIHPFLTHNLPLDKTDAYIRHLRSCPSCSDDLEIHFIVQAGLEQLDNQSDDMTDLTAALQKELEDAELYVHFRLLLRFVRKIAFLCANGVLLLALLLSFDFIQF